MKSTLVLATALCISPFARATPFSNLSFESATITDSLPQTYASTDQAVPGWTVRADSTVVTTTEYGQETADGASLTVLNSNYCTAGYPAPVDGHYSFELRKGAYGAQTISIAQTGDVPGSARSLQFVARDPSGGIYGSDLPGTLNVTLNGQSVPLFALSRSGNDVNFAVDVSTFAGQSTALAIILSGAPVTAKNPDGVGYAELDDFQFSTVSVPEPVAAAAFAAAGTCLIRRRRRQNSRA